MKLVYTKDIALPAGYKRVDYIQSSGTQYIISDVTFLGDNYKIECKYDKEDVLATTAFCTQGTTSSSNYRIMCIDYDQGNGNDIFYCGEQQNATNRRLQNVLPQGFINLTIEANNGVLIYTINGQSTTVTPVTTNFDVITDKMWIFGNNRESSTQGHQLATMKFYYFKVSQNGTVLHEYIPVLNDNNVAGVYDLIDEKFLGNDGTGTFTYGNVIAPCKPRFIITPALPIGYTRVEYLQSSGTQWIDTGVSGNNPNLKIEVNATTYEFGWLHNNNASGSWVCAFTYPAEDKERVNYGNYNQLVKTFDCDKTVRKVRVLDFKSGFYIDGVLIQAFTIENYSSLTPSLSLFARYDFYDSQYKAIVNSSYKIYSAKIYDNNILVRNYVPCLDDSNVPCMYDTVTKTPYYNAGDGSFSYGDPISQYTTLREIYIEPTLPEGYTKLNYIESTGTQYINTGLYLSNNHSVMLDYQYTTAPASGERTGLFGTLTSQTTPTKNPRYGDLVSPSSNKQEYGYGINNLYYQTDIPDTNRHVINHNKNEVYVDGVLINRFNTNAFECTTPAYLCNFNYTNYVPPKAKYYRFKVWDRYALIRDFIPMLRTSDTTPGMYDLVNKVFYTNNGTGTFLYG